MSTNFIQRIFQRPGCLGAILLATFVSGVVIALLGYSLVTSNIPESIITPTATACQIELTVTHSLYDEREDYYQEGVPIGELEPGIYGVIGLSDDLIAIDWRGNVDVHPPTLEMIDWIYPIETLNPIFGDCRLITRFASVAPQLTTAP